MVESSDNAERLEESKVITGNWLSDPEHLAGSDPLVSLLSEGLLHRNWLRRKTAGFGGFKGSFQKRH